MVAVAGDVVACCITCIVVDELDVVATSEDVVLDLG